MRPVSFFAACSLVAFSLIAPQPAHAAITSPVQVANADQTASAVDAVALRHRRHRPVRHRRVRHRHHVSSPANTTHRR